MLDSSTIFLDALSLNVRIFEIFLYFDYWIIILDYFFDLHFSKFQLIPT